MSKGPLLGLVLTAMAGWVDAIGFLRLGGFYPSFMSGNTTQLGVALSNGNWQAAMLPALLVGLFVTGVFAAAAIADSVMRRRLPSCFLLETFVLAAAMLFSAAQPELALALAPLAFAMGLQTPRAGLANLGWGSHSSLAPLCGWEKRSRVERSAVAGPHRFFPG